MLLAFFATAQSAEIPQNVAILQLTAHGIGGGPDGGVVEIPNIGGADSPPISLKSARVRLRSDAPSVIVPAAGKVAVELVYDGKCQTSIHDIVCADGTLKLSAPGGEYRVSVPVYVPGMFGVGRRPATVFWNPTGPLPPEAPPWGWESGNRVGGNAAFAEILPAARGEIGVHFESGTPTAARDAFRAAMLACDEARTEAHSKSGEEGALSLAWGQAGDISGLTINTGSWDATVEPCLAGGLIGQSVGLTTPGSARLGWKIQPRNP